MFKPDFFPQSKHGNWKEKQQRILPGPTN